MPLKLFYKTNEDYYITIHDYNNILNSPEGNYDVIYLKKI